MDPEPDEKAIKRSVSIPPALLEEAQARADAHHGGNLSRYLQHLIQADVRGATPRDQLQAGAEAFVEFRAQHPGNYADKLQRAVADGRPFAEIAAALADGDAKMLALLRRAYDFLAGKTAPASPNTPPVLEALLEIRDLLQAGAHTPAIGEAPQTPYPNSPSGEVIDRALRRAGRAGKAVGAANPRQTQPKPPAKPPRGE